MEAKSVEDDGAGVTFNVYVYNVQPYIVINYETGEVIRRKNSQRRKESGHLEQKLK